MSKPSTSRTNLQTDTGRLPGTPNFVLPSPTVAGYSYLTCLKTRLAHFADSTMSRWFSLVALVVLNASAFAEPIQTAIDTLVDSKASGAKLSKPADDAELLRRAYLDFSGTIPSAEQARAFFADKSLDKRAKLIEQLLASPTYPKRMAEMFHVMLMERLGDYPEWSAYLKTCFEQNKHWDAMTREILRASSTDAKGASFFLSKRLENYGQNSVDYSALTRDIGRLFLGKNLQCAECHDHLFIKDYKQQDFKGIHAFVQNAYLADAKTAAVAERPTSGKLDYMSVFKKVPKQTGPSLPGGKEFEPPTLKKGEEYIIKPDPKTKTPGQLKFSPLAILAEELPKKDNSDFALNGANRIWFLLMGRGIVHPLDLHHKENAASHPELLVLLAKEFAAHDFDIKWLLKQIALSQAYQRSSEFPEGETKVSPESFRTAIEKRLSAEQLLAAMQQAMGVKAEAAILTKVNKAFANAPREPEDEINPSLKAALFLLNDPAVLAWLVPSNGNLVERLGKLTNDKIADELYLSVLTRLPASDERGLVESYLKKHAGQREKAIGRLAWSLLASAEFGVNH